MATVNENHHFEATFRSSVQEQSEQLIKQGPQWDIGPKDIVLALMGVTGVGKSTFISNFAPEAGVGHTLESYTQDVQIYKGKHGNDDIYLVDTPGFDDTYKSDADVLRELSSWLGTAYQDEIKLTGIIYLHRISDPRLGGSAMKNLRIFKKLCGEEGLGSVVLATTMWGNLPERSLGEMREKELIENKEFWGGMMGKGSRVFRHDNGLDSAKVIVDHLVKKKRPVVLEIQKQLVDQGMTLEETAAGMALYQEIQHHVTKLSDTIKELQKELASSRDKDDREEIELQLKEMAQKMRERERDQRRLQESWEQMMEEDRKRRDAAEMERERLMTEKHALEIERVMMRHQSELEAKNLRLEDQQRRLREKDSKGCCVM